MDDGGTVIQIVVDYKGGWFLMGFGDGKGRIDQKQGRPKRFKDPLKAMDWAERCAETCRRTEQRYFADRLRPVKLSVTLAYWAMIEAEKVRLDAGKETRQ